VAALAVTFTDMRDTIKCLTAQNGRLHSELQTAREKLDENTRAATTPPPRARATRFFFYGRMGGSAHFLLHCFSFVSFVCGLKGEKEKRSRQVALCLRGQDQAFLCPA
jgi:hypothetical protein